MTNAELIEALRECEYCNVCSIAVDGNCQFGGRDALEVAAADALEAAEQRIAELEAQLPKEGEWVDANGAEVPLTDDGDTTGWSQCSVCGDWLTASDEYWTRGRYCPNCGARMKG